MAPKPQPALTWVNDTLVDPKHDLLAEFVWARREVIADRWRVTGEQIEALSRKARQERQDILRQASQGIDGFVARDDINDLARRKILAKRLDIERAIAEVEMFPTRIGQSMHISRLEPAVPVLPREGGTQPVAYLDFEMIIERVGQLRINPELRPFEPLHPNDPMLALTPALATHLEKLLNLSTGPFEWHATFDVTRIGIDIRPEIRSLSETLRDLKWLIEFTDAPENLILIVTSMPSIWCEMFEQEGIQVLVAEI